VSLNLALLTVMLRRTKVLVENMVFKDSQLLRSLVLTRKTLQQIIKEVENLTQLFKELFKP
jgi:hypothetical protein